jgi:mannose-6-phosphate isomerase-like protein (cupin superfamily)
MERTIYNPLQKDTVTFLSLASDTMPSVTVLNVILAAGGGVGLHYHKTYAEHFECLEGVLSVEVNKKIFHLQPGESATAPAFSNHRFFNESKNNCIFQCTLTPGSRGFEESLQIAYGLARDGAVKKNGFPKNKLALAYLFVISESNLKGWRSIFEGLLHRQAKKAIQSGLAATWRKKYIQF